MAAVLMSYITSSFQSKSDMRVAEEEWQAIIQEMAPRFKAAGAIRQTVSHVWNKEGAFMLGNMWEYKDEKAFIECQKLFREAEKKFEEQTSIASKNFATRAAEDPSLRREHFSVTKGTVFINSMLIDFQSENDLELYISNREQMMTAEVYERLEKAGLKRQVIAKVWNKDQHRLSVTFEYQTQEAFKEVEKIYEEVVSSSAFMKKFTIKYQNNRAVVLVDFVAQ